MCKKDNFTRDYVESELESLKTILEETKRRDRVLSDIKNRVERYNLESDRLNEQIAIFEDSLYKLTKKYNTILEWLTCLASLEQKVLTERYIEDKSYIAISLELHYSERNIYLLRKKAINKIVAYLNKE